jgi:molecular chaperone DnaK (HSP70)
VPYLLGVDIGSGSARTAVCRRTSDPLGWGPPEPVQSDVPPAVSGLFRRCGDDVPVYTDELFVTPQALLVEQARGAADAVWAREQEGPERFALAYPTTWGPGRLGPLRAALDEAGMSDVVLMTRARAVIERHRATGRHPDEGRPVAVCRIGGLGTEVARVVPGRPGRLELLAAAEDSEVGGDDLAEGGPAEGRAVMAVVLDMLRRTARACGIDLADLAAVLLAGGGTTRPIVTEVLAEAVAAPVLRDDDPRHTVACGAAASLRPSPGTAPSAAVEPLVLPTDLMPVVTGAADTATGPGAPPPRPPLHVDGPEVKRR